jgi:hypothetical protein
LKKCHKGPFQVISKDKSELFGVNKENMPINPGTKFFSPHLKNVNMEFFFHRFLKKDKKPTGLSALAPPPYGQFKPARVKIANVP